MSFACFVPAACGGGDEPQVTAEIQARLAAHAEPRTWEDLDPAAPGTRLRDPRSGVIFLRVPAGEFVMGGTESDEEKPPHTVTISRSFLLAETELTVAQWRRYVEAFAGDPKVPVPAGDAALPMPVSWDDAQRCCERFGYRLPSEAEWERACRGGLEPGQGPWLEPRTMDAHAWFNLNAGNGSKPVRTRTPNAYGLFDMLGNLSEWCADWFFYTGYQGLPSPCVDPRGPQQGVLRVLRGGSWFTVPGPKPWNRGAAPPGERTAFYGCRPARNLE